MRNTASPTLEPLSTSPTARQLSSSPATDPGRKAAASNPTGNGRRRGRRANRSNSLGECELLNEFNAASLRALHRKLGDANLGVQLEKLEQATLYAFSTKSGKDKVLLQVCTWVWPSWVGWHRCRVHAPLDGHARSRSATAKAYGTLGCGRLGVA